SEGKHLRFIAQTDTDQLPVVAFGWGNQASALAGHFSSLQIVGTMSQNSYRGNISYQLMLRDMSAKGAAILDRSEEHTSELQSLSLHDALPILSEGKHLRFIAQTDTDQLPVVAFGWGNQASALAGHFSSLQIVGTMSQNSYRGNISYQLMLRDMSAKGAAILD